MHGASPSPSPVTPSDREREDSVDVAPPTALSSLDLLSGVAAQLSAEEATDSSLPPSSSHHPLYPPPSSSGAASYRLPSLQQQHLAPRVATTGEGAGGGAKRARHSLYPPVPHHQHQHQRLPRPPHLPPHRPHHPHPHPQPRPLPSNGFAPPRLPPPTSMANRPVYHFQPPVQHSNVARAPSPPTGSLGRARQVEKEAWEGRRVVSTTGGGPVPSSSSTAPPVWRPGYGAPPPQHPHPRPHEAPEQEKHNHLSYKPLYERRNHSSSTTSSSSTRPAPLRPSGVSVSYRRPPPRQLDTSFLSSTTSSLKLPSSYGTSLPTPVSAPLPPAPAAGSLGVSAQGRTIYSTPSSSSSLGATAVAEGRRGSMGGGPRTRASVSGGGSGGGELIAGGGAESAKGMVVGNGKGMEPIVSSTLWEDERTIVMQVLVEGHVVARRADNDWINSTKLLNMAGLTRGKRDMYLKNEPQRVVFRRGALHLKGVWLPLEAAERLAHSYNLHSRLYPLFEPRIQKFLFTPLNRDRTTQLVRAARAREAMPKPEDEQGIGEEEKKEREERSRGLERLLRRLEVGLGLVEREEGDSEDDDDEEEGRTDGGCAKDTPQEQAASTSLAAQHPATSLHAISSSSTGAGEPPLVTASYYSSYAASTASQQAAADPAPRVNSSFALPLQHLQRLQQQTSSSSSTDDPSRRPSMDIGFTHDYQTPVSWYDNPTPPEGANAEYISAGDIARRLSSASVLGEGGDERELGAVMEGEEMNEWGTEGVLARSRPPPVVGGFGRRMSAPVLQSTALAMGGRYAAGGGGGRPATSGAHLVAQQQQQQQKLAVLPPSADAGRAQSVPAGSNDYGTFTFPPSSAPPVSSNPHPFTFAAPAPHQPPAQTDSPPTLDLPALLADLHTLQQQRPASPFFASSNVATYSPLSRFNATRLSIDSAAEAVYPHVGLGATSLVAPHAEHVVEQYEVPDEGGVGGGNYSWAPTPPAQCGQDYSASSAAVASAPSPGAFLPEETPRTAPGRTSFSKQYLFALSAATSAAASTSSASTAPSPAYSTLPSASASASASPEAYYSFPSTSASTTATSLSVRSSSKRILEDLDALDALEAAAINSPSSTGAGGVNGSAGQEKPYEHPAHSLSSSRRGSVIALEVAAVAGQARHATPAERRDSILGAMVTVPVEQREEEVEVAPDGERDVKRRRVEVELAEEGEGEEMDIEVGEPKGEAVLREDIEVEEGEVVEGC